MDFGLVTTQAVIDFTKSFGISMVRNLAPTVKSMFITLCTIDLVLAMLYDESDGLNIFIKLFKKLFYYLFFWWIIINYVEITYEYIYKGFVQLGNVASGIGAGTVESLKVNTKSIDSLGLGLLGGFTAIATGGLFAALDIAFLESVPVVGLIIVASVCMFFIYLYIHVLYNVCKFFVIAGFAYVLMPFAGFSKTKDITSKALNGLFAQGIEVFIIVVMLNFLDLAKNRPLVGLVTSQSFIPDKPWGKIGLIVATWFLLIKTTSLASSLMSGALANLGFGASGVERSFGSAIGSPGKMFSGNRESKLSEPFKGGGGKRMIKNAYKNASSAINRIRL